jgi:hypothetical protein
MTSLAFCARLEGGQRNTQVLRTLLFITVSKRLQVRAAKAAETATDSGRKLQALRDATSHSFPTADIEEMLAQIERGSISKHRDPLARQSKAMITERAKMKC